MYNPDIAPPPCGITPGLFPKEKTAPDRSGSIYLGNKIINAILLPVLAVSFAE